MGVGMSRQSDLGGGMKGSGGANIIVMTRAVE